MNADRLAHWRAWRMKPGAGRLAVWLALASLSTDPAALGQSLGPRHLEYRIAWNGIPAASAVVEVSPEQLAADRGYVVTATASTNPFVDLFWRFRGHARTAFLAHNTVPLSFKYERHTNNTPEITWIDFDLTRARAQSVYIKKTRRKELEVDAADVVDPITAIFRAMTSAVELGQRLSYLVFTGETHYRVNLQVTEPDVVDVPAGRFEALKVEPEIIKLGDEPRQDKRLRRATIWVTPAPARTLLRIRSEVFVGAVTLDLVRAEPAA